MLLTAAEDRATLRSDQSVDREDYKAESDADHVALLLQNTILCGKSQCAKPQVRAEPDEPKALTPNSPDSIPLTHSRFHS